jgi:hypothetical protein
VPPPDRDPGASRRGKAAEHLVAASCILASQGALNASTALVDDEGVDVVFHRRGGSRTLAVQVKSRFRGSVHLDRDGRFIADVRQATFRPRSDFHVLFVIVDAASAEFGPVWLVPSLKVDETGLRTRNGMIRFSASAKPNANDQWRPFRLERSELAPRLLSVLGEL